MTDGRKPGNTPRCMPFVAAMLALAVILLPAAPADAGLLGRSIGVGGAGHSLKKNLGRLIERAGEMADAAMDGDKRRANKIWDDVRKTPARIIKDALPILGIGAAAKDRLKSAENKIKSFVGKARETVSGAGAGGKVRSLVTDARAALAVSGKEKDLYGSRTGILGTKPLPAASVASASPVPKAKAASGGRSPWFKQWVLKQQQEYPECWGVVKAGTDPDECMARAKARKEAEKKARKSAVASAAGTAAATKAKGSGGTSGDREAKNSGWGGWDRSDSRYDDEDREAARVSLYAARCWGIDGVSNSAYDPMFPLMKRRMRNNECPEEDKARKSDGDTKGGYDKALSKTLDEDNRAAGTAERLSMRKARPGTLPMARREITTRPCPRRSGRTARPAGTPPKKAAIRQRWAPSMRRKRNSGALRKNVGARRSWRNSGDAKRRLSRRTGGNPPDRSGRTKLQRERRLSL